MQPDSGCVTLGLKPEIVKIYLSSKETASRNFPNLTILIQIFLASIKCLFKLTWEVQWVVNVLVHLTFLYEFELLRSEREQQGYDIWMKFVVDLCLHNIDVLVNSII